MGKDVLGAGGWQAGIKEQLSLAPCGPSPNKCGPPAFSSPSLDPTTQMIARGKNASDLFPAVVKNVACKNIEVSTPQGGSSHAH